RAQAAPARQYAESDASAADLPGADRRAGQRRALGLLRRLGARSGRRYGTGRACAGVACRGAGHGAHPGALQPRQLAPAAARRDAWLAGLPYYAWAAGTSAGGADQPARLPAGGGTALDNPGVGASAPAVSLHALAGRA